MFLGERVQTLEFRGRILQDGAYREVDLKFLPNKENVDFDFNGAEDFSDNFDQISGTIVLKDSATKIFTQGWFFENGKLTGDVQKTSEVEYLQKDLFCYGVVDYITSWTDWFLWVNGAWEYIDSLGFSTSAEYYEICKEVGGNEVVGNNGPGVNNYYGQGSSDFGSVTVNTRDFNDNNEPLAPSPFERMPCKKYFAGIAQDLGISPDQLLALLPAQDTKACQNLSTLEKYIMEYLGNWYGVMEPQVNNLPVSLNAPLCPKAFTVADCGQNQIAILSDVSFQWATQMPQGTQICTYANLQLTWPSNINIGVNTTLSQSFAAAVNLAYRNFSNSVSNSPINSELNFNNPIYGGDPLSYCSAIATRFQTNMSNQLDTQIQQATQTTGFNGTVNLLGDGALASLDGGTNIYPTCGNLSPVQFNSTMLANANGQGCK